MRTLIGISYAPSEPPKEVAPLTKLQPWESPVAYLYGGLGATLGLIVVALLMLVCTYRKSMNRRNEVEQRNTENGEMKQSDKLQNQVFEEKFVVIMAGEEMPTFLATPVANKGFRFDGVRLNVEDFDGGKVENGGKNAVKKNEEQEKEEEVSIGGENRQPGTAAENQETAAENLETQQDGELNR